MRMLNYIKLQEKVLQKFNLYKYLDSFNVFFEKIIFLISANYINIYYMDINL